jgi:hypothetical protein
MFTNNDKRQCSRIPLSTRVKITHPSFGSVVVMTRDLSNGGAFLVTQGIELPPIGSILEGQVQDLQEEAPIVKMKIVREEADGVGVKFCD